MTPPARREELAVRSLSAPLDPAERAELDAALQDDPAFARDFEAARIADAEATDAARWLRRHPDLALPPAALERIAHAAAGRRRRPLWRWLAPALALGAAAVAAVVFSFQRPSPDSSAARGAALYAAQLSANPATRVGVWPDATGGFTACLWLDEAVWQSLPPSDRAALVAHLRAQVPAIRAAAARHAGPPDAPGFVAARDRIARLDAGPWLVMGLVLRDGAWVRSAILAQGS
jgi:hypothetical protein